MVGSVDISGGAEVPGTVVVSAVVENAGVFAVSAGEEGPCSVVV